MKQPEVLKTDAPLTWSTGTGRDVSRVLVSCQPLMENRVAPGPAIDSAAVGR
jgi:hypothetical protein